MFQKILIANRGEIATRIMRTAQGMGVRCVAVYSDADTNAMHVRHADESIHIGGSQASESYLCGEKIIEAALQSGAQAIHPGYGFLSENPDFVDAVNAAGLVFVGPSAEAIRAMGLKDAAKTLMHNAGVPVVPGYHGSDQSPEHLAAQASSIGYPVMIKARAGGGGKGMRMVQAPEHFPDALNSAAREGKYSFGDAAVLIEKYIENPRHIEVQVLGDNHGNVIHLYERDCSLQRRHQKVIEEAPAPGMTEAVRSAMTQAAITAAQTIGYSGAGTVEFIVDGSGPLRTDGFWFMEMNTRLQVEHPVTEAILGIDLVEEQLKIASNEPLSYPQDHHIVLAHAIEARLYAEDVNAGFLPATGKLAHLSFDQGVRVDTGVASGDSITPYYDPMIAKVIAQAPTRSAAIQKMQKALSNTHVAGTVTNIEFLAALMRHEGFTSGTMDTSLIERNLEPLTGTADNCASHMQTVPQLLAAIVLLRIRPTSPLCGWRLFGQADHLVQLNCQNTILQRRIVLGSDGHVSLHEQYAEDALCQLQIVSITEREMVFIFDGKRQTAQIHEWSDTTGRNVSILLNGQNLQLSIVDPLNDRDQDATENDAVTAPMTGIIRLVDVQPQQIVKAGDRLLVMEAMKMETSLNAPRDGIIESVSCVEGDSVEGGSVLLRLAVEPDSAD